MGSEGERERERGVGALGKVEGMRCRKLYNWHKSPVHRGFPLFPPISRFPVFITFLPSRPRVSHPSFALPPLLLKPPALPTSTPTSLKPSALYSSPTPLAMGFIGGAAGQPLRFSIHLNFISTVVCLHAFFIDPLFVACCMGRIYPPCPWDCISEP